MFKYYYNNNTTNNQNKKYRKKYTNYKLMKIPFVKDLNKFLKNIHIETTHKGSDAFRNNL